MAAKDTSSKRVKVEEIDEEETKPTVTEDKKDETTDLTSEKDLPTKTEGAESVSTFKFADVKSDSEKSTDSTPASEVPVKEETPVENKTSLDPATPEESDTAKPEDPKEWLKDIKPEIEGDTQNSSGGKKIFFFILILVIVAGLIGGGIYYYQTQMAPLDTESTNEVMEKIAEPTSTPEEEEASPSAEMSLDTYSVNVLNGSGIAGEAGKVSTALEAEGFENIDTGNASSYDYIETEVSLKEEVPTTVYDAIKNALEDTYIITKGDELDEDSEFDIEIIVGSKKANE